MLLSWSRKWLSKHDTEVRNYKEKNLDCIKQLPLPMAKTTKNKTRR